MEHDPYAFLDEEDDEPVAPGAEPEPSGRHDGFTRQRRRLFLRTLRKTGCVADACRYAGISDTTAYKWRHRDPDFRAAWDTALSRAGSDIETLAWQRGVEGVEEEVWAYGKPVGMRRRTDPRIFRMLLQASNPARYGGQGYGSRKALEKKIRKQIEAEREAEIDPEEVEAARERIARRIEKLQERYNAGLEVDPDTGRVIPPGYIRDPDYIAPATPAAASTDADWQADRDADDDERPEPGPADDGAGAAPTQAPRDASRPRAEPRIIRL